MKEQNRKQTQFQRRLQRKTEEVSSADELSREKFSQAKKALDEAQREFNRIYAKSEQIKRITRNYEDICAIEEALGNRLDNANNPGYIQDSYHYNRLRSIIDEVSKRSFSGDRSYSREEQATIRHYVEGAQDKIISRTMNEQEYNFLMKSKPKHLIREVLRGSELESS